MKPTAPLRKQVQSVCHDTLPWLISFSLDLTMPFRATIVFLISVVAMSVAQEPNKEPKDAGRGLRNMFLTTSPEQAGIHASKEYPRVWGVAVDWPIGDHIATIVSLADGSASVYTTSTFGIIGGIGHETVRSAAKKVLKEADRYFEDSTPTKDFSYPPPGHVRFFFTTFSGVRVIDTDWASLSERRSKYFELFDAAQDVLTQLRMVSGPDMK